MKKIILLFLGVLLIHPSKAQPSMTILNHWQITPNTDDTSGVFCRTFYHSGRNKFYTVYAGRPSNTNGMQYFAWREYDQNYSYTGNHGTLSGFSTAGDYAMVMVGTNYYHLTDYAPWGFRLTKYDDNFNIVSAVTIPLDSSDSQADMMMDYTNGKLIIGAFHETGFYHPSMPQQQTSWMPNMHKWEYDLNLNPLTAPVYLNESFTPWGGSCIYNNNQYNIVTMDKFPNFHLHVYQYDNNWNFVDSLTLNTDGQWSQGLLWDGTYYYVAYHAGHEHRSGNIVVAMYDVNWNLAYDTTITTNPVFVFNTSPPLNTTEHNANRPSLLKKNDTLYVSYDVDDYQLANYTTHFYHEGNRWMANVTQMKISGITGIKENNGTVALNIYPDPSNGIFNYSIDRSEHGKTKIIVTDISGKQMIEAESPGSNGVVDLSDEPSGIYFASFVFDDGTVVNRKLVKE
jgi:hypothetical protein